MSIHKLDRHLVNQIAAGEVVERPASVIRELLDNAIDAGASRLVITLENGGIDLIRVRDNGLGIPPEELALALQQHATSKISTSKDLDEIFSLGFRGEALASIASVSRLKLASYQQGAESGAIIEQEGSEISEVKPWTGAPGTMIEARNLFFNTPARRRFLKSPTTEVGHINTVIQQHALAHPEVAFEVEHNGRPGLDLPVQSQGERVKHILGKDLAPGLMEVQADESYGNLWAWVAAPSIQKNNSKSVHLFVNGRPIRDARLLHGVREAYRGLMDPRKYPVAVIFLTVNPCDVDVNVHPAKSEVRFIHANALHHLIHSAIRTVLLEGDLTPGIEIHTDGAKHYRPLAPGHRAARQVPQSIQVSEGEISARKNNLVSKDFSSWLESSLIQEPAISQKYQVNSSIDSTSADYIQVHNSYVLTQDEEGLLLVDQHALHERFMYYEFITRIESKGCLESQPMLIPLTLKVSLLQQAWVEEMLELFHQIGMDVHIKGEGELAIHAFPSLLIQRKVEPGRFLMELLEKAEAREIVPSAEDALHQTIDMMSCKAAIKAHDQLTESEMQELLARREEVECASNCPHGRPTVVRLSSLQLQ